MPGFSKSIRDEGARLAGNQHQRDPRPLTIHPPSRGPSSALTAPPPAPAPAPPPPAPVQTVPRTTSQSHGNPIPPPLNRQYDAVPRRVDSGYQGSGSSFDFDAGGAHQPTAVNHPTGHRMSGGSGDEDDNSHQHGPPLRIPQGIFDGPLVQSPTEIESPHPAAPWNRAALPRVPTQAGSSMSSGRDLRGYPTSSSSRDSGYDDYGHSTGGSGSVNGHGTGRGGGVGVGGGSGQRNPSSR